MRTLVVTLGVVALAGLAITLERRDDDALQPTDCAALRAAVEDLPPDFPEEARRRLARDVCGGFHRVPEVPSPTAVAHPGCGEPGQPVEPVTKRTVRPPDRTGPFLARVRGKLPATGTPVVAGVRLPRGSRCKDYWATDLPSPDAIGLARQLAAAFPKTGLWPIVWESPYEGPDAYFMPGNPARADGVDLASELRRLGKAFEVDFDGLGRSAGGAPAVGFDPFDVLERSADDGAAERILLLVPVHRPADAVTVTGFTWSELLPPSTVTAALRSWEDRYGAVLVEIGPGYAGLAVGTSPAKSEIRRVTTELAIVAHEGDTEDASAPFWRLGWPD